MANSKEIQGRIKSIQDTMKITSAMYMISSTKLRKAKNDLEATEPYFYTLQSMISRILRHLPDMEHPYFDRAADGKDKTRGYLVITADKGMAGAYNHNVFKMTQEQMEKGEKWKLFVVGELGRQYFAGKGEAVEAQFHYTAQNPTMHRARVISGKIMELYEAGELDEVYIVYTRMVNSIQAQTEIMQLLPLQRSDFQAGVPKNIPADVLQEEFQLIPSPRAVIDNIIPNYVTGYIYCALVESFCSEQNARMMAMDAANKSASAMIHDLSILYNRVRQAMITQEITEVISGAKAQKRKKKR